jgi:hypothetical protein
MRRDPCLECGADLYWGVRFRSEYCSSTCSKRHRDRLRYQADPEAQRAKSRAYYAANRERIIERVKAYQARKKHA